MLESLAMSDGYEGGTPPPDGPRNLAGAVNGLNWVVFAWSWVSVVLRTITRVWISHNFGWDDAMMILCQVGGILAPRIPQWWQCLTIVSRQSR